MANISRHQRRPAASCEGATHQPEADRAGVRTMKVPAVLQPLLKKLAQGKNPGDRLFGDVDRYWVRHHVRRLCRLAKVPVVPPPGQMAGWRSWLGYPAKQWPPAWDTSPSR